MVGSARDGCCGVSSDGPFRSHERIRLPLGAYQQPATTWLVTVAAHDRGTRPFLLDGLATSVVDALRPAHRLHRCRLLAYCLMPDHLHFVTEVEPTGDLVKLISAFKSFTTRLSWHYGGAGSLWQTSFHDRGLRAAEDIEEAVRYVWENPVRWGLAIDDEVYPYRGVESATRR